MDIFPAIDLLGGNVVRLLKGDYEKSTLFSRDPVETALSFRACGARYLHLVDLDGARTGDTVNMDIIGRIALKTGLKVEVGGGIRTEEAIARYLDAGVWRVILGTVAAEDPAFLAKAAARYGQRIAVGADVRDGFVAVRGWYGTSGLSLNDMCLRLRENGIRGMIVTDIGRDGTLDGPNTLLYAGLVREYPDIDFTASGGVSCHNDLAALRAAGVAAAIVGKALYTGDVSLKRALEENA